MKPWWNKEHIGMVHWSSYWSVYSLVLDVDSDGVITELDSFGEINHSDRHRIRTHNTVLSEKDKFYTMEQFYNLIIKSYNNLEEK